MDRRYLTGSEFRVAVEKGDPTDLICIIKPTAAIVKAVGDPESRLMEFTISEGTEDREGDLVEVKGWDFEDYKKNPVVLFAHDHSQPVVGRAVSLNVRGNQVRSITEFTPADLNPLGAMLYKLYAAGFMHAVSVGFQPKEFNPKGSFGMHYTKQGLLEYSCVPVPSHPRALTVARSKGIDTSPIARWASKSMDAGTGPRALLEALWQDAAYHQKSFLDLGGSPEQTSETTETVEKETSMSVTKIEKWACGLDGHAHDDETQAKACKAFDLLPEHLQRTIATLGDQLKSGRTLSPANQERLKNAVAELDKVASAAGLCREEKKETKTAVEGEGEEEAAGEVAVAFGDDAAQEDEGAQQEKSMQTIPLDPAAIESIIRSTVDEKVRSITGRLD